jgi:hypothetical protein
VKCSSRAKRLASFALPVMVAASTGAVLSAIQKAPGPPSNVRITKGDGTATTTSPPRFYDVGSPWNTPIPATPSIDPGSAAMAQAVYSAAQSGGFLIAVKKWTWPVYVADSTTAKYTIGLTASWAPAKTMNGVPIPASALPDPSGDAHMIVIDSSTSCEYDFWQAAKQADGQWTAGWANATASNGAGWYAGGYSATGSGTAGSGGLILPEELNAGVIPHALAFAFPLTKAGGPVLPATESDGKSTATGAIPEGARLQLDPALDLTTLGLSSYEMTIAAALQRYGMFLTDSNSGGVSFAAQNPQSGTVSYPWGDQTYVYLPVSLLSRLRVLTLGPQYTPTGYLAPGTCATFK